MVIQKKYAGLVLFDIDDTLSTGSNIDNAMAVDYCLKRGYAVGICTAGALYTPENLGSFKWMPKNLIKFMHNTNNITFNNVARRYICNIESTEEISNMINTLQNHYIYIPPPELIGYIKGYATAVTGSLLGLPRNRLFLLDNDPNVLYGFYQFDSDMNGIPAGNPAGYQFTVETVKDVLLI